jgi:hypothetical protein
MLVEQFVKASWQREKYDPKKKMKYTDECSNCGKSNELTSQVK